GRRPHERGAHRRRAARPARARPHGRDRAPRPLGRRRARRHRAAAARAAPAPGPAAGGAEPRAHRRRLRRRTGGGAMIDALLAPCTSDFMLRAVLVTLAAAVACALLSTWLVQMGWSLMGDAVSHAVLPGVALAYILGLPFALGAAVFGIGAVALIGGVRAASR